MSQRQEVAAESLRAVPAIAAAGFTVGGVTLQDWVLIVTLVYIILQIAYLLFRWLRLASQPSKRIDTESGE
jgi:hypothetical protein